MIGIYERFLAQGQKFRESGGDAAYGIYNKFSRGVRHVPFLENFVGSSTTDLYDAIFDVDASHTYELFDSDDEDSDSGTSVSWPTKGTDMARMQVAEDEEYLESQRRTDAWVSDLPVGRA